MTGRFPTLGFKHPNVSRFYNVLYAYLRPTLSLGITDDIWYIYMPVDIGHTLSLGTTDSY